MYYNNLGFSMYAQNQFFALFSLLITVCWFLTASYAQLFNFKPVAQRHPMVSHSLALLFFIGLDLLGSRAAALIGDKVLWNGEIFFMYVHLSVHSPLWAWALGLAGCLSLRPG